MMCRWVAHTWGIYMNFSNRLSCSNTWESQFPYSRLKTRETRFLTLHHQPSNIHTHIKIRKQRPVTTTHNLSTPQFQNKCRIKDVIWLLNCCLYIWMYNDKVTTYYQSFCIIWFLTGTWFLVCFLFLMGFNNSRHRALVH